MAREYPVGFALIAHAPRDVSRFLRRLIRRYQSPEQRDIKFMIDALKDVADLDPEFFGLKRKIERNELVRYEYVRRGSAPDAWVSLFTSLHCSYERIVFIPHLVRGGADLVAVHAIRALMQTHGEKNVLVVATDRNDVEAADWLGDGIKIRVLPHRLTLDDRSQIVRWLIQALRPKSVLNIQSHACWRAIATHGAALSSYTELYGALFSRDQTPDGDFGYDRYLQSAIYNMNRVYFDNETFRDRIANEYRLPKALIDRLSVLYQPAPNISERRPAEFSGSRFPVMWASRICKEKNINVLLDVVRRGHEFSFDAFGSGGSEYRVLSRAAATGPNLTVHGAYSSFADLPVERFGAFIYTTRWDGLPNVLLEAAAAGLPIVAPNVGGIGELVDSNTGWLLDQADDPNAYIAALREIRDDPEKAHQRVQAMYERIRKSHCWDSYIKALSSAPSFLN